MRIHLALHGFPPLASGGTEQYTLALGRALREAGNEVTVLAPEPATSREVTPREDAYGGLRVVRLGFDPARATNPVREEHDNPVVARFMEGYWARERPDLLHVTYPGLISTAPLAVAEGLGIPTVVTLTDMWAICPVGTLLRHDGALCAGPEDLGHCLRCLAAMGPRGRAYARWVGLMPPAGWRALAAGASLPGVRRAPYAGWLAALRDRPTLIRRRLLGARALASPGRFLPSLLARWGYPAGSVRALPHGIPDPKQLRRSTPPATGDGPLRFGYSGPLARFKGAHLPLEAYRLLPAGTRATLTYRGAWPPEDDRDGYAHALARAVEATPGVEHAGPYEREHVGEALEAIDVLIVPSLCYENTPMVIYEALASGTPVIAAAEGGMRELVKEYAGGWLVPRGDAQALADCMVRLAADPAEVRRVAAGIRPVPSLAGHVAALGAVYAEALAGGGRHG